MWSFEITIESNLQWLLVNLTCATIGQFIYT